MREIRSPCQEMNPDPNGGGTKARPQIATMTTPTHHLIDEFNVYRTNKTARLELHNEYIKIFYLNTAKNGQESPTTAQVADVILNLKDIAGSSVGKGKEETDTKSYFTLYAYLRTKEKGTNIKRKRKTFEFAYGKLGTYDENFQHVNKWHLKLYNLLRLKTFIHQQRLLNEHNSNNNAVVPTTSACAEQQPHREIVLAKPFLVFVNPKSGSGKAKNIYFERALPVWAEANIPDTAVFTRTSIYTQFFQL